MPIAYLSFVLAVRQDEGSEGPERRPLVGLNERFGGGSCGERWTPHCIMMVPFALCLCACRLIACEPRIFMWMCDMRLEGLAALCLSMCAVSHVAVSVWIAIARKTGSERDMMSLDCHFWRFHHRVQ